MGDNFMSADCLFIVACLFFQFKCIRSMNASCLFMNTWKLIMRMIFQFYDLYQIFKDYSSIRFTRLGKKEVKLLLFLALREISLVNKQ